MKQSIAQLQAATTKLHTFVVPTAPFFDTAKGTNFSSLQWRILFGGFHARKETVPLAILLARVTGSPGQYQPGTKQALDGLVELGYLQELHELNVNGSRVTCYKLAKPGDTKEVFLPADTLTSSLEGKLMALMQVSPKSRSAPLYAKLTGRAVATVALTFQRLHKQGFISVRDNGHCCLASVPELRLDLSQCEVVPHPPLVGMAPQELRRPFSAKDYEGIDVSPILPSSAALLQQAMKETPAPKAEPAPASRTEAKAAFDVWRQDYTWEKLEEMPAADAGKAILWMHALLATSLAGQPVGIAPQHLGMVEKVVEWARDHVANPNPDDLINIAIRKNAPEGATRFVFESVLALYSCGYNGWTYAPTIIFDPGDDGGFQRHAVMALAMLNSGTRVRRQGLTEDNLAYVASGIDKAHPNTYWPKHRVVEAPPPPPPRKLTFAESLQKMILEEELAKKQELEAIERRRHDRAHQKVSKLYELRDLENRLHDIENAIAAFKAEGRLDIMGRFEKKLELHMPNVLRVRQELADLRAEP